ncbi:MAG: TetR/AcrR family transcriptional regulator, partial [Chloroflexota bacterium]
MTDQPDRREAILRAALKVFSQHGFHKASIKQIAHAAGLKSTSHIYW